VDLLALKFGTHIINLKIMLWLKRSGKIPIFELSEGFQSWQSWKFSHCDFKNDILIGTPLYFMNAVTLGCKFAIMSSCVRAQSIGSSSTPHPYTYITSSRNWRTMVRSAVDFIFLTTFSAHALRTCQRHKKILALSHTRLHSGTIIKMEDNEDERCKTSICNWGTYVAISQFTIVDLLTLRC
jgi:hypothetical protein